MEEFESVLESQLTLGTDVIGAGIPEDVHELCRVWVGETHSHARFEAHILLSGACRVDVDSTAYTLQAGQAAVIAPGSYHRLVPVEKDCERLTIGISVKTSHLRQAMSAAVQQCAIVTADAEFLALCRKLMDECAAKRPYWKELARLLMSQCLLLLLRMLGLHEEVSATKRNRRDVTLDIIDNYFESNLAVAPGAEDLAAKLHISRRHLGRILQETYGMGFREMLLRARMDQAAWLLRHTDKSVSAIAGEVGYTYDSAFRQAFRDRYGMTPLEYRQQKQKG